MSLASVSGTGSSNPSPSGGEPGELPHWQQQIVAYTLAKGVG